MKDLDDYPKACPSWRHKWVIQEKEMLPSLWEEAKTNGMEEFEYSSKIDPSHKSCIVTYVCYRCGSEKVERI